MSFVVKKKDKEKERVEIRGSRTVLSGVRRHVYVKGRELSSHIRISDFLFVRITCGMFSGNFQLYKAEKGG
jgi:hypothetical protein